jgi:LemA protein
MESQSLSIIPAVAVGIAALACLLLLLWAVWIFNRMVRARNQQQEAWSGIDVQLRKRHDLVPSLVEIVRGYSAHEKNVLVEVTEARGAAMGNPNRTDAAERDLTSGLRGLFALAENYPQLKADRNFQQLSSQLVEIEEQLQFARRYYNGSVRDFRNLAQTFPQNIVAKLFGFQPAEFFEVECATERQSPKVEL